MNDHTFGARPEDFPTQEEWLDATMPTCHQHSAVGRGRAFQLAWECRQVHPESGRRETLSQAQLVLPWRIHQAHICLIDNISFD